MKRKRRGLLMVLVFALMFGVIGNVMPSGEVSAASKTIEVSKYLSSVSKMKKKAGGKKTDKKGYASYYKKSGIQYGAKSGSKKVDRIVITSKKYKLFGIVVGKDAYNQFTRLDDEWIIDERDDGKGYYVGKSVGNDYYDIEVRTKKNSDKIAKLIFTRK